MSSSPQALTHSPADVLDRVQVRKRRGDKVDIACPLCGETDPRDTTKTTIEFRPDGSLKYFKCYLCDRNSVREFVAHIFHGAAPARLRYIAPLPVKSAKPQPQARPSHHLNRVYQSLLSALPLSQQHRDDLHSRGLDDEQITRHGYRTLPWSPYRPAPTDRNLRREAAEKVAQTLGEKDLRGVPGFFVKAGLGQHGRRDKWWTLSGWPGLLIPYRNPDDLILGLQIRRDDNGVYNWFSGGKGATINAHAHLARPATVTDSRIWITEGGLKAGVAAEKLGAVVIGLPGVGSQGDVLSYLGDVRHVVVSFDADFRTNTTVNKALLNLLATLDKAGLNVEVAVWELTAGKGIDDLLAAGGAYELLTVDAFLARHTNQQTQRGPRFTPRTHLPAPTPAIERAGFREELKACRLSTLASNLPIAALDASCPGGGKTFATAKAFATLEAGGSVAPSLTFTTTHDNCEEAATIYREHGLIAQRMPKRDADNCYYYDHITGAESLGLRASLVVCQGCKHYHRSEDNRSCPYWSLVRFAEMAPHTVAPYARLQDSKFLQRVAKWKDAAWKTPTDDADHKHRRRFVLDETPIPHLRPVIRMTSRQTHNLNELFAHIAEHLAESASYEVEIPLFTRLSALAELLTGAISEARRAKQHQPLPYVIPNALGETVVRADGAIAPEHRRAVQNELLSYSRKSRDNHTAVADALSNHCIDVLIDYLSTGVLPWQPYVEGGGISFRMEIDLPADAVVLVQDATSKHETLETVLGRKITDITPQGRLEDTGKLHQILDCSFSRASLQNPKRFALAVAQIRQLLAEHSGTAGLLSYKGDVHRLRDALSPEDRARIHHDDHDDEHSMVGWFGRHSRGLNKFQGCDLLIIVGTPRPQGSAYWQHLLAVHGPDIVNVKPAKPSMIWRTVETDDGEIAVQSWGFADPVWDAAYQQIVVAELGQAAGRGRHHDATGPVTYVLSSEPCGLSGCSYELRPLLSAWQQAVYEHLAGLHVTEHDSATNTELADRFQCNHGHISKALKALIRLGLVEVASDNGSAPKPPLRYRAPQNTPSYPLHKEYYRVGTDPLSVQETPETAIVPVFDPVSEPQNTRQSTQLNAKPAETGRPVATGTSDAIPLDDYNQTEAVREVQA